MTGCGGGAYCPRSCPAAPKIEEPWLVERPSEIGSIEEDGAKSVGRSGRVIAWIKSVNAGCSGGCKLDDVVEEANKLANTLLLVLPLLLELVVLLELPFSAAAGVSSNMRWGFSGNSVKKQVAKKETQKGSLKLTGTESSRLYFMRETFEGKGKQ